jgi:hypothetical protein
MIPSQTWFPTNLAARAAWFQNFNDQFKLIGTGLGFTAGEIAAVDEDNAVFQFLADADVKAKAYGRAIGQFRTLLTEDDVGKPTPDFPGSLALAPPATVPAGLFERLAKLVDRIRVAPAFTNETGALLGILPRASGALGEADVKPSIEVTAAQTGYLFAVVVSNRGAADMWEVLLLKKGAAGWQSVKTATGKAVDVTVAPTTAGEAEQVQARVQLRKNNQNYGQPSAIEYVTVNP